MLCVKRYNKLLNSDTLTAVIVFAKEKTAKTTPTYAPVNRALNNLQPWVILPEYLFGGTQVSTFQFYVKEATAVHLNIGSTTFLAEKEQLVAQGFERVGDVIQADNSEQAFEKFKDVHLNELGEFTKNHLVASVIGSLSGY